MTTILLTGASGFVGSHVLPELLRARADHEVLALVRAAAGGEGALDRVPVAERPRVRLRIGDVTRPETLGAALAGADAVVHLAAIPRDFNGGRDLRRINTEGTRHLLDAARTAGVRRFVHLGAMGVSEDPRLHYASSKARAERLVRDSGLDWTILKPSLLWGEGDGFFSLIARLARFSPGVMPVPGRGRARFQPLYIGDLAQIVAQVLARADAIGRVYELGGPRHWTYREITAEVLAALGKQRLIVPVPVPLISLVARGAELVRLPFPAASDQLRQLALDNTGPLDLIEREFGFQPRPMNAQLGYLRGRGRRSAVETPPA